MTAPNVFSVNMVRLVSHTVSLNVVMDPAIRSRDLASRVVKAVNFSVTVVYVKTAILDATHVKTIQTAYPVTIHLYISGVLPANMTVLVVYGLVAVKIMVAPQDVTEIIIEFTVVSKMAMNAYIARLDA